MKLALHRSATFWCGLLSLLFFLGVWIDSTRYSTGFALRRLQGVHEDGALDLTFRHGPGNYHSSSVERLRFPSGEPRWFAPYHWEYATGFFIRFTIPHWLILLAIALPWSALLVWRARRRKRFRR